MSNFSNNPMWLDALAEVRAYINSLRGLEPGGKNHSTERRTGPHRASGETNLGTTGGSARKRVPWHGERPARNSIQQSIS